MRRQQSNELARLRLHGLLVDIVVVDLDVQIERPGHVQSFVVGTGRGVERPGAVVEAAHICDFLRPSR